MDLGKRQVITNAETNNVLKIDGILQNDDN